MLGKMPPLVGQTRVHSVARGHGASTVTGCVAVAF